MYNKTLASMGMCFKPSYFISGSLKKEVERGSSTLPLVSPYHGELFEERKEKLKKLIWKTELSVSAYDTAWVAMVPSLHCPQTPSFPQCVNWLLDHQFHDGSWRLPHQSPDLLKDVLQSTLACVLALKKWGVGEEKISKGVRFIQLNITSAVDRNLFSPIGFDIIFPGMLQYARNISLDLGIQLDMLDTLLHKRDMELHRNYENLSEDRLAYLAYVSEGTIDIQDWKMVMKYQQKNGSLLNSPSTTAAALTQIQNSGCRNYLSSVLKKFGNAVPTIYPLDLYATLSMVDNLEKLGVARFFTEEINVILDEIYRCWLQDEGELVKNASTCALAFRLLRKHGYDVCSDSLVKFLEERSPHVVQHPQFEDIHTILELYQASEIVIHPDEGQLEKSNAWTQRFLEEKLSNVPLNEDFRKQVDDVLRRPFYADLERVRNRRTLEHFHLNSPRVLKTSYCLSNIGSTDFLELAVEDFNLGLNMHRKEFAELKRWIINNKLDTLKFARKKPEVSFFSAVVTFPSPELSDVRMSWAKSCALITILDDFFDVGGSMEEMKNLIELVERWDVNMSSDCLSVDVEIMFIALKSLAYELGDKAIAYQGRNMISNIVEIWLDLLKSFMREAEWGSNLTVPTLDEYMNNAYVSLGLGPIILPALYLICPKLPQDVVKDSEVQELLKLASTCGRLLNDIQSYEREAEQGKLNAVSLHMIHAIGGQTKDAVVGNMWHEIKTNRRELLRLVLQRKDQSVVPKVCKDVFWSMSQVLHFFYSKDDGFSSKKMDKVVETIFFEPVSSGIVK